MESRLSKSYGFGNIDDSKYPDSSDFFCKAIENADGVPFQLIFGPHIGEGHYLTIGSGIEQLLGIPPEDLTEKIFREMIGEVVPLSDDIPFDPEEARRKFISGELKSYRAEVLVTGAGGENRWIRDASLPLVDNETGKVIGAFGILYDISDNKNSQITIEHTEKQAWELDRLKKSFLSNISHEIRTPLNAIVGFSTLLGEPGYNEEQLKEFRELITRNTDHLLEVITDIVEMSKIESDAVIIRKEKVNLSHLLHREYNRFKEKASEKGIALRYSSIPAGDEVIIITDKSKITQVLANLLDNALKFTISGSVDFGYELKEGNVEFYITDTGIGIPLEQQCEIFKRFYQGDSLPSRKFEGIGLGLTIAKAYVELLGGTIWFTSHPGEGSDFRFLVEGDSSGE